MCNAAGEILTSLAEVGLIKLKEWKIWKKFGRGWLNKNNKTDVREMAGRDRIP